MTNKLTQKYLEKSIFIDLIICLILGVGIYLGKDYVVTFIKLPSNESIEKLSVSIITVGATLIGFLLTIITVIVTFKKGFEDTLINQIKSEEPELNPLIGTEKTIFDNKITKETQFYGTILHKKVVKVFIQATYEIGLILFVLLGLQFNLFSTSDYVFFIFASLSFLLLVLSIIRSFYIFQLFLNVHLHNKID